MRMYESHPQARMIEKAIEVLRAGGLVVYPTDTLGLGCNPHNKNT